MTLSASQGQIELCRVFAALPPGGPQLPWVTPRETRFASPAEAMSRAMRPSAMATGGNDIGHQEPAGRAQHRIVGMDQRAPGAYGRTVGCAEIGTARLGRRAVNAADGKL
jgi:hypothetical protein